MSWVIPAQTLKKKSEEFEKSMIENEKTIKRIELIALEEIKQNARNMVKNKAEELLIPVEELKKLQQININGVV